MLSPHLFPESQAALALSIFLATFIYEDGATRAIPGSRLPLYVAAGALRVPFRLFAKTTAFCSVVWISAIFAIWRLIPKTSFGHQLRPWLLTPLLLFVPWLLSMGARSIGVWMRKRERVRELGTVGLCAR